MKSGIYSFVCLLALIFFLSNLVNATPPSRPSQMYISNLSHINNDFYLTDEEALFIPSLNNYIQVFSDAELLFIKENYVNDSIISINLKYSDGTEIILGQSNLGQLYSSEEFFDFFVSNSTLHYSMITKYGLDTLSMPRPLCNSTEVIEIINILNNKTNLKENQINCYYPLVNLPSIDSTKLNPAPILNNSKIIILINNKIIREYSMVYSPGMYRPSNNKSFFEYNWLFLVGIIIILIIIVVIFLLVKRKK